MSLNENEIEFEYLNNLSDDDIKNIHKFSFESVINLHMKYFEKDY